MYALIVIVSNYSYLGTYKTTNGQHLDKRFSHSWKYLRFVIPHLTLGANFLCGNYVAKFDCRRPPLRRELKKEIIEAKVFIQLTTSATVKTVSPRG